jgi:hypothetical protein
VRARVHVDVPESFKKVSHYLITVWIKALPAPRMKCWVLCPMMLNCTIHFTRRISLRRTSAGGGLGAWVPTIRGARQLECEVFAGRSGAAFPADDWRMRASFQPNAMLHATRIVTASPGCLCASLVGPAWLCRLWLNRWSPRRVGVQPGLIVAPASPDCARSHGSESGIGPPIRQPVEGLCVSARRGRSGFILQASAAACWLWNLPGPGECVTRKSGAGPAAVQPCSHIQPVRSL